MPKAKRTPLTRLERHCTEMERHVEAVRGIIIELQGEAVSDSRMKQLAERETLTERALQQITGSPGMSLTQLQHRLRASHGDLRPAITALERRGVVRVVMGQNRARMHYLVTMEEQRNE